MKAQKDINNKTVLAKRPKVKKIDRTIERSNNINLQIEGDISKVNIISTGSTTHAQSSESKFMSLEFTKIDKQNIQVKLENNPNILQRGTYLIFILNSKGVPSEGKIIFIK